jgi:hypothetical protein
MNWTLFIYGALALWGVSATGCNLCYNAMRTVWYEPKAYSWKHDRRRSIESYSLWADAALADEASRCPDRFGEPDYIMGFRDGFVDFVYLGGTGEPPPVPPRQFWNVMLRSPEGNERANLWFDGYRHGAAVARDGGYRELGRVRSSLAGIASGPQYAAYPSPIDGTEAYGADESLPYGEMLPELPADAPRTTPAEGRDAELPEPENEPQSLPAPRNTPAVVEPPFRDDPEPPADENGRDQPLSMNAPALHEQAAQQQARTADGDTPLAADVEHFGVQPAILLNEETDGRREAIVIQKSPASTMRFVNEQTKDEPLATTIGVGRAGREVRRTSFRGWSRRITADSTSSYQIPQAQGQ